MPVAPRITLNPDRSNREDKAIRLPFCDRPFLVGAKTPDRETRAGERVARQQLFIDTDRAADLSHLVLIKGGERLNDRSRFDQSLNAAHPIVVRFDEIGFRASAGFDGVWIDRALAQNPMAIEEMLRSQDALLHFNELFADCAPLGL